MQIVCTSRKKDILLFSGFSIVLVFLGYSIASTKSSYGRSYAASKLACNRRPGTDIYRNPFSVFDPEFNNVHLNERIRTKCTVNTPNISELVLLRAGNRVEGNWSPQRFVMYYNIVEYLRKRWSNRNSRTLNVLDATGSEFLKEFSNILNVTETSYPEVDLHKTPFESSEFDVVSADQVIEHAVFPHKVMLELHRILKPGGIAIVTSVSYNPRHFVEGVFNDYWRFMLDGMMVLSAPFKSVKSCGTWGTGSAIATRATSGMSSGIGNLRHSDLVTKNEKQNPFLAWVILER